MAMVVLVVAMKRQGRPPLDASAASKSADVHLTLSTADYDKAARLAQQYRKSIQDIIRCGLKRLLDERSI